LTFQKIQQRQQFELIKRVEKRGYFSVGHRYAARAGRLKKIKSCG
jgi:hypothetical protein